MQPCPYNVSLFFKAICICIHAIIHIFLGTTNNHNTISMFLKPKYLGTPKFPCSCKQYYSSLISMFLKAIWNTPLLNVIVYFWNVTCKFFISVLLDEICNHVLIFLKASANTSVFSINLISNQMHFLYSQMPYAILPLQCLLVPESSMHLHPQPHSHVPKTNTYIIARLLFPCSCQRYNSSLTSMFLKAIWNIPLLNVIVYFWNVTCKFFISVLLDEICNHVLIFLKASANTSVFSINFISNQMHFLYSQMPYAILPLQCLFVPESSMHLHPQPHSHVPETNTYIIARLLFPCSCQRYNSSLTFMFLKAIWNIPLLNVIVCFWNVTCKFFSSMLLE